MKSDFLIALTQLVAERHLPREEVLQAVEAALVSAFKKDSTSMGQDISVKLNPNTGEMSVFALRTVVEEVEDPTREISLQQAKAFNASIGLGEEISTPEQLPHQASRIAAQTAKQVVLQRLREAEREKNLPRIPGTHRGHSIRRTGPDGARAHLGHGAGAGGSRSALGRAGAHRAVP